MAFFLTAKNSFISFPPLHSPPQAPPRAGANKQAAVAANAVCSTLRCFLAQFLFFSFVTRLYNKLFRNIFLFRLMGGFFVPACKGRGGFVCSMALTLTLMAPASLLVFPPAPAQAASIDVIGGSGGGGGGGAGSNQKSFGGNSAIGKVDNSGKGGDGGYAPSSGAAGGGGGAGLVNGITSDTRNGKDANGTTVGAGGTEVNTDESPGQAGTAGSGNLGGAGGAGGAAILTSSDTTADNIFVTGGNAGGGGQGGSSLGANGGNGGAGGAARLTINNSINVTNLVTVQGGDAGSGTPTGVGNGINGSGGYAAMTVDGTLTAGELVLASKIHVSTGSGYSTGQGGSASFVATTVAAPLIVLNKNIGANLAFKVGTLDATNGDTNIKLGGTVAGTARTGLGDNSVYIGTAKLGDGTLTVAQFFESGAALINTLELTGSGIFNDNDNPVTLGSLTLNGGTLNASNWAGIMNHAYTSTDITLGTGGGTFAVDTTQTINHKLIGSGSLTKNGTGTLILTGTNTYSGGTTVGAGTLQGNANSIQGDVTNNAAVVFNQANAGTYAGNMSGSGSLNKSGAGILTLSGVNNYTGATMVQTGTLTLGSDLSGSNDLTLNGGTTFDRGSFAHALDNGSLTINGESGQSATYSGDLAASGATLNFISPVKANAVPLLSVDGDADITNSKVNFAVAGGSKLPAAATYTLLQSTGALSASGATKGSGVKGISQVYTYELAFTANSMLANVQATASDPAVQKSPAEGKAATVALANQGADLAAGLGISNARTATRNIGKGSSATSSGNTGNFGVAGFGAMSGGNSRYNSGSHVDVDSLSLMTGLAKTWQVPDMDILAGIFFEAGWGSYTSYNGLNDVSAVNGDDTFKGKGNSRYMGGGLLGRVDATEGALRGVYGEASLRVGGLQNDYRSDVLPNTKDERARYDNNATYYGAHAGLGYIWELTEAANLDLYGKYFWAHTTANSARILDDDVDFKAVNSHRTRLGGRLNYALNEFITPYIGTAWDYEFDGKAKSVVAGENAPAPSLKGSTGMGELGLSWEPAAQSPLTVDFGVQGYVGMREGVSGNVQLRYEF